MLLCFILLEKKNILKAIMNKINNNIKFPTFFTVLLSYFCLFSKLYLLMSGLTVWNFFFYLCFLL